MAVIDPLSAKILFGVLVGCGGAVLGFVAKEAWKKLWGGGVVDKEHCKSCKAEIKGDLVAGSAEFRLHRRALAAIVAALIPLCKELVGDKAVCQKLEDVQAEMIEGSARDGR